MEKYTTGIRPSIGIESVVMFLSSLNERIRRTVKLMLRIGTIEMVMIPFRFHTIQLEKSYF